MKKLQSKRVAIGVLIVVVLGFYWIDTVRIQRNVRRAVSNSLSQSLKSEIALQPTVLSNGVPAKDQGDPLYRSARRQGKQLISCTERK